ncbi:uncharacterized protein [Rutidosis leptorrhynchoides]|uniref:uncharacterized protein n=1 Tax=Rutidosis leptorrhynchoides TaxID=125765 RepID=UPI003A99AFD1
MENGNGGGVEHNNPLNKKSRCEDVISKLKDDGDFDRLRLSIIRKLKDNEELRNSIVSIVKQSEAINRPGAENLKPRQLSDAIHLEVGGKLNEKISDGIWEIMRSPDGMKSEITETVKSVYYKLTRPTRNEKLESSGHNQERLCIEHNGHRSNIEVDGLSANEPKEPSEELQKETIRDNKEQGDGSDDDLDAPPGFG